MDERIIKNKLLIPEIKNTLLDSLVKKLIKNSSIILFGNTATMVLNFVSFIIIVNSLGAKLLGLLVLAQTYVLIINNIFNIQTWESMVKFSGMESHSDEFKRVVKANFLFDLISALIAFLVTILFAKPIVVYLEWDPELIWMILLYSFTIPFNLTTLTIGLPRLFNKFSVMAKIQIYTAILKLVLVLIAAFFNMTIFFYIGIYLIIDILTNVMLIFYSLNLLNRKNYEGWWKVKFRIDTQQIKFIWWTNLRSIVRIPVRYCDMIIISLVMPLETVGIYKVYKEIAGLLGRVGEAVNQAIFPEYARLIGTKDSRRAVSLTKKTILLLSLICSVLTLFLLLPAKYFVGKIFGVEFLSLINGLYLLIILSAISFITTPINSLFVAAGFARIGFNIVVLTNVLYLLIALIFGKLVGIYGIITALGVQMLLNKGLKIFFLWRYNMGWDSIIR